MRNIQRIKPGDYKYRGFRITKFAKLWAAWHPINPALNAPKNYRTKKDAERVIDRIIKLNRLDSGNHFGISVG